jgi:peptide/nickel transport system permease protein
VLAPHDLLAVADASTPVARQPPSVRHPLGADALGRDVLARVLVGGRVSLAIGVGVELFVAAIGGAIGLLAGYYGAALDAALMRLTDVAMAFPSLVLAIGAHRRLRGAGARQRLRRPHPARLDHDRAGRARHGADAEAP